MAVTDGPTDAGTRRLATSVVCRSPSPTQVRGISETFHALKWHFGRRSRSHPGHGLPSVLKAATTAVRAHCSPQQEEPSGEGTRQQERFPHVAVQRLDRLYIRERNGRLRRHTPHCIRADQRVAQDLFRAISPHDPNLVGVAGLDQRLRRHRFSAPRVTRGEIRDQQPYCRKTMAVHCRLTPFAMAQSSRHPSRAGQARLGSIPVTGSAACHN